MKGFLAATLASLLVLTAAVAALTAAATAAKDWGSPRDDRATIIAKTMTPYTGPSVFDGPKSTATNSFGPLVVDPSTMTGKVMCGYQGWHLAEGDGAGRGWYHWTGRSGFKPGSTNVDLWPDVSELDRDERYATPFRKADGSVAEVYSAFNEKTVVRHFKWMRDYGIDGVFLQRFVGEVAGGAGLRHFNVVLQNARVGANTYGRTYGVMYDLSGMGPGQANRVIDDWKNLIDKMQIGKDKAYIRHAGKPVVVLWGIGFSDGRRYTLADCMEMVKFLKDDPKYGATVMVGVPTHWRTLDRDAVKDSALTDVILKADIVNPWTVGRYSSPNGARAYEAGDVAADVTWCKDHKKEYMPVVFPGFSWHNMNPRSASDQIPRLGGDFLWAQYAGAKKVGCTMIYESMFDEVDEGTAIYKVTNDPPVGESIFVTYHGLPSDHYLRVVGMGAKMLRGEIPQTDKLPDVYFGKAPVMTPTSSAAAPRPTGAPASKGAPAVTGTK